MAKKYIEALDELYSLYVNKEMKRKAFVKAAESIVRLSCNELRMDAEEWAGILQHLEWLLEVSRGE